MHVVLVIAGGLLLLGVFILFGWLWGASASAMALAAKVFMPIWLAVALINMWVGVHHAGYAVREELPILILVFALPAATAMAAVWRLAHG